MATLRADLETMSEGSASLMPLESTPKESLVGCCDAGHDS